MFREVCENVDERQPSLDPWMLGSISHTCIHVKLTTYN